MKNTISIDCVKLDENDVQDIIDAQRFYKAVDGVKRAAGRFWRDQSDHGNETAALTYVALAGLAGKAGYRGGRQVAAESRAYARTEWGTKEGLKDKVRGAILTGAMIIATW